MRAHERISLDRDLACKVRAARFFLAQKRAKLYQISVKLPIGHKMHQMAVIYSKWLQNILTFSIPKPSKIYPNWNFWSENKPSGNPVRGRKGDEN
jgi:hypothetical protein